MRRWWRRRARSRPVSEPCPYCGGSGQVKVAAQRAGEPVATVTTQVCYACWGTGRLQ